MNTISNISNWVTDKIWCRKQPTDIEGLHNQNNYQQPEKNVIMDQYDQLKDRHQINLQPNHQRQRSCENGPNKRSHTPIRIIAIYEETQPGQTAQQNSVQNTETKQTLPASQMIQTKPQIIIINRSKSQEASNKQPNNLAQQQYVQENSQNYSIRQVPYQQNQQQIDHSVIIQNQFQEKSSTQTQDVRRNQIKVLQPNNNGSYDQQQNGNNNNRLNQQNQKSERAPRESSLKPLVTLCGFCFKGGSVINSEIINLEICSVCNTKWHKMCLVDNIKINNLGQISCPNTRCKNTIKLNTITRQILSYNNQDVQKIRKIQKIISETQLSVFFERFSKIGNWKVQQCINPQCPPLLSYYILKPNLPMIHCCPQCNWRYCLNCKKQVNGQHNCLQNKF